MPEIEDNKQLATESEQIEHVAKLRDMYPNVPAFVVAARAEEPRFGRGRLRFLLAEVADAGLESGDLESRRFALDYLVEHLERGDDVDMLERVIPRFRRADFSPLSHDRLQRLLEGRVTAGLARIAGVAEVKGAMENLREAAAAGYASNTAALSVDPGWNAALALVRMGEAKWQRGIEGRVRMENDIVLRATRLFRDLGYTKTQASFDCLARYLDSEERLPTVKPTQSQGEREAAHAARIILEHVEEGPVITGLSDDEIVSAVRIWAESLEHWPIWR